ncbi:MAG: hypothetical protein ACYDCQ_03115 [Dehalococcoidia bacterium]
MREYRLWLAAGGMAALGLLGLVIFLLSSGGTTPRAQRLAALATPGDFPGVARGDVRQVTANNIAVAVGGNVRQLPVPGSTRVEALLPAAPSSIMPGDFVSIGGAPNLVNSIAVKLVVVIPAAEAGASAAGVPRSKGGFTGWEAYLDSAAPRLYGRVDAIDAGGVHVSGGTGSFTLTLDPKAEVRRLTVGGVDLIQGGDHVAFVSRPEGTPGALLVLPQ